MKAETFANVFDAIAETSAEAASMTVRADLLIKIRERVRNWNLAPENAADRLGLTQPRLGDLMRGKVDKFTLDALVDIAAASGFLLRIEFEDAA